MSGEEGGRRRGQRSRKEGSTLYLLRVMGEEEEHQYFLPGRKYRWNLITLPAVVASPCWELYRTAQLGYHWRSNTRILSPSTSPQSLAPAGNITSWKKGKRRILLKSIKCSKEEGAARKGQRREQA